MNMTHKIRAMLIALCIGIIFTCAGADSDSDPDWTQDKCEYQEVMR